MRILFLISAMMAGLGLATPALAADDIFTSAEKKQLMDKSLKVLWEKGVDTQNKRLKPKNDKERKTRPVSEKLGNEIINNGIRSAVANWCQVPWQDHYLLYMQHVRKTAPSTVQIAYAGILHGMAQGTLEKALKDKCPEATQQKITSILQQDSDKLKQELSKK